MKVALAQLNPIVGDIQGNLVKAVQTLAGCSKDAPDLVVFPELFLVGYPPRDLLERPSFIAKTQEAIQDLLIVSKQYPQTGIILGAPQPSQQHTGKCR